MRLLILILALAATSFAPAAAQRETVGLAAHSTARAAEVRGLNATRYHPPKRRLDGSRSDPSNARPTLAEAGIDKHLADRARKYAAIPSRERND
jgi:hypothetical protein